MSQYDHADNKVSRYDKKCKNKVNLLRATPSVSEAIHTDIYIWGDDPPYNVEERLPLA